MVDAHLTAPFKDLYPFSPHFLPIGPYQYHYLDEGEGEPLLMLHGNPTWSFYYRILVRGLRHQNRCVVPDHMGCGLSDKPQDYPYTLETHIDNVERLADHLKLERITLVMHDWGGAIGMGFAIRRPDRIKRLVLFNTAAFLSDRIPWRIKLCRHPWVGPFAILTCNAFASLAIRMASKRPGRMGPRERQGYLAPYRRPEDRIAHLRFVQDIPLSPDIPSYSIVERIESRLWHFRGLPVMIIWGMKDFCFDSYFLNRWKNVFRDAEVHEVKDAGHYVVEDASEEIIPWVIGFLRRHPIQ